jgi:hypothetical protein
MPYISSSFVSVAHTYRYNNNELYIIYTTMIYLISIHRSLGSRGPSQALPIKLWFQVPCKHLTAKPHVAKALLPSLLVLIIGVIVELIEPMLE